MNDKELAQRLHRIAAEREAVIGRNPEADVIRDAAKRIESIPEAEPKKTTRKAKK